MNRKILIIFGLIIFALLNVCIVCAEDTLELNDIQFNIPDDYDQDINVTTDTFSNAMYYNDDDQSIVITVTTMTDILDMDEIENNDSYIPRTIAGKSGYLYTEIDMNGNDYTHFIYPEGKYTVEIAANDDKIIEGIINGQE